MKQKVSDEERHVFLKTIAQCLHDAFPRYDWVGFYFVDPMKKDELVLGPYVGALTGHVRIPFGKGICGQAAVTHKTFVVDDVSKEENYLSCSVNVKSEIVIPLMKHGEFVGEIDIDSHTPHAFSEEDRVFLEHVAQMIATIV